MKWPIRNIQAYLISLESGSRPKGGVSKNEDGIISIGAEHLNSDG